MGNDFERDYEDEVYEDEYYEEHFEEEELIDDEELVKEEEKDIIADTEEETEVLSEEEDVGEWDEDKEEQKIDVSYACEDCDYRWEDVIIKKKTRLDEEEEPEVVCPMCGSTNITQI